MSRWEMVRLGDVCEKKIQSVPTIGEFKIDYVDISSINNLLKKVVTTNTISLEDAPNRARQILEFNDILISTVRPNLNAIAINRIKSDNLVVGSTGFCILRCKSEIDVNYLFNFCKSKRFINELIKVAKGASYPAVSNSDVMSVKIPLPPLDIQKQIANTLDTASVLISLRKQQLEELDNLIESVFYDMFGDPVTNQKGWEVRNLKDITKKIGSGATPKGGKESYKKEGISLIRSMNVHDNKFIYKDLAFIDEGQSKQLDNVIVEEDDVLLNITGASVARSCIVPKNVLPARVNQHVSIIRLIQELGNKIYLNNLLINDTFKQNLLSTSRAGGATREALTKVQLEELSIPLPPIQLQNEFAYIVIKIEEQKSIIQKSIDDGKHMFDSLMSRYFD